MSVSTRKIAVGCLFVVAGSALAWSVRGYLTRGGGAESDFEQTVLCSACGYLDEVPMSQTDSGSRKTLSPDFGPGATCPKCNKRTLYLNPVVCEKCNNSFLMQRSPKGAAVAKCPKCAWTR